MIQARSTVNVKVPINVKEAIGEAECEYTFRIGITQYARLKNKKNTKCTNDGIDRRKYLGKIC